MILNIFINNIELNLNSLKIKHKHDLIIPKILLWSIENFDQENLEKKELIYNIISFMNTIILKIELSKEVFDIFFLILIKLINKNY